LIRPQQRPAKPDIIKVYHRRGEIGKGLGANRSEFPKERFRGQSTQLWLKKGRVGEETKLSF